MQSKWENADFIDAAVPGLYWYSTMDNRFRVEAEVVDGDMNRTVLSIYDHNKDDKLIYSVEEQLDPLPNEEFPEDLKNMMAILKDIHRWQDIVENFVDNVYLSN